ncbi:maleylpyruvate isomerase N-terminal domain-containing protein [Streptomyces sp. NBC_00847]|uniref:maleylpyruvate isomerase N-terminal domain-containing protein n=1 Tax=Streptomyces sp. NBC_00847 TaxID=2975850 RepID=UPI00225E0EB2|nr:maleylpyruvate isomerase N-terminal domain-containing protein [Streptomyces sp. NBC_00847]MCX4885324.1 maleylpyruvate isomerase N-terminal domain-containing protein [Streptomyces sp. NBC_00847]
MSDPTPVFDDLREESEELDRLVAELSAEQWALATPAPGWSVAHQIARLAWTDHSTALRQPKASTRATVRTARAICRRPRTHAQVSDGPGEPWRASPRESASHLG